jgi:hypothetical protein
MQVHIVVLEHSWPVVPGLHAYSCAGALLASSARVSMPTSDGRHPVH